MASTLSREDLRLRNSANASNSPRSQNLRIDAALAHASEPTRMCRVCRQRLPKAQLTRWVRKSDGSVVRDETQRLAGRGAYTCSAACATKLPLVLNHSPR